MSIEWEKEFADPDSFSRFVLSGAGMSAAGKRMMCEENRGPCDMPPTLLYATKTDVNISLMPFPTDDYPAPSLFTKCLNDAYVEWGVPLFVSFLVEAYAANSLKNPDRWTPDVGRGELQRAFVDEADPSVSEAITCFSFDLMGTMSNVIMFYKYDDAGQPIFDDPIIEQGDAKTRGAIVDVVRNFLKFVNLQ